MDARPRRLTPALAMSIAVHGIAIATLGYFFQSSGRTREAVVVSLAPPPHMVWIPDPRPAARGGGGRPQATTPAVPDKPAAAVLQPIPAIPLRRPPPAYTADAMRARLQGVVVLNCVVQPDGRCSDIRVMRSLDAMFGLDEQAIASAREWRFRPGQRLGSPVPVQVTLEIAFNIR